MQDSISLYTGFFGGFKPYFAVLDENRSEFSLRRGGKHGSEKLRLHVDSPLLVTMAQDKDAREFQIMHATPEKDKRYRFRATSQLTAQQWYQALSEFTTKVPQQQPSTPFETAVEEKSPTKGIDINKLMSENSDDDWFKSADRK